MNPIKNHIYFVPSKYDFTQFRGTVTFFRNLIDKNPLKVLIVIGFRRFKSLIKKIYTFRGYVTFFIEDWRV